MGTLDCKTDIIGNSNNNPPSSVAVRWHLGAQLILFVSMLTSVGIGIFVFVLSLSGNSNTAFGFAFDTLLDTATSMIVFWRFYGSGGLEDNWDREKQACIGISVCFIISSFGIFSRTMYKLLQDEMPEKTPGLLIISCLSCVAFAVISWFKFAIGNAIRSISMRTDAFNSATTSIMALGLLASTFAQHQNEQVWFLDSIIAIVIALVIFVYGLRLLTDLLVGNRKEWTFID
ncbi:transmembrane protein 163-like isoform X2 [Xenia sp. Carnegie-2017]|uniref:transmembrane protein 163-like isoform X2 n=1 Tax=Xenia sp. Carnegie-2017 TaxID=2897299 RepID=UPI001F03A6CC|nr:transmembrane protein 163-like isoform X2 [Xenia sp. Carnegie-2017]